MISAPGEPPGSRVSLMPIPSDSSLSASMAAWVDLPVPSPPSNVMNFPFIHLVHQGGANLRRSTTLAKYPSSPIVAHLTQRKHEPANQDPSKPAVRVDCGAAH